MSSLAETADKLRAAYSSGPIAPLRGAVQPTDGESAYAIQAINTRH
jgi:2-keto-4-pentenoate hydratase